MLPKKDGLQILSELRLQVPKIPNKAVVILTNLGQDSVIKQCFDLGAQGFLIKSSLNPEQVLDEIKTFLSKTLNG